MVVIKIELDGWTLVVVGLEAVYESVGRGRQQGYSESLEDLMTLKRCSFDAVI